MDEMDKLWESQYAEVSEFFRRGGIKAVPAELCAWLDNQASLYTQGRMPSHYIQKLCRVEWGNYIFGAERMRWESERKAALLWIERFRAVHKFVIEHGRFPTLEEEPVLRTWIYDTRNECLTERVTNGSPVDSWMARAFKTYIWGASDLRGGPMYDSQAVQWKEMLERLAEYARSHGDIRVSTEEDAFLSNWVAELRQQRIDGKLASWQKDALLERGILLASGRYSSKTEAGHANRVQEPPRAPTEEFKEQVERAAGLIISTKAPIPSVEQRDLYIWLNNIEDRAVGQTLSPYEMEVLLKAGFCLTKVSSHVRSIEVDTKQVRSIGWLRYRLVYPVELTHTPALLRWYQKLEGLKVYVREKNMLPTSDDANAELCHWYGSGCVGGLCFAVKHRMLNYYQIRALTEIGIEILPDGALALPGGRQVEESQKRTWKETLGWLSEFLKEYGHLPTTQCGPFKLYSWCRGRERESMRGRLPAEKRQALLSIGIRILEDGSFAYGDERAVGKEGDRLNV